jgi:hypothetical protein
MMIKEKTTEVTASQDESPLTFAYVLLTFFCIALVMFGDLLIQSGNTIVSHHMSDGSLYFARMREFGFGELAKGNMPLWNPHIYSGTPYVGAFQTGMFYPLNAVYLALPIAPAMNVDFALHVLLMSVFMYLWARKRGLSWVASFVAGIVLAYGGASFVRVMAGQITMLQTLSWAPLILVSIDHIVEKRSNGWMLIGIGATTMQILAGHPQSLFMTALAAGMYSCIRLISAENRMGIIGRLIPYGILPPLIGCVQLWTGLDTAKESMRSAGVSYEYATTFSFHPESLLTLLMPALFGNMIHAVYWGRWAFWDSTVFMGIGGLALMLCSLYYGQKAARRFSFTILFLFVVIAFGSYAPVFGWLYEIPGFNAFRSPSKFMFPASLFAAMLAGLGVDAILQGKITTKTVPITMGVTGLICLLGAAWLGLTSLGTEPGTAIRQFIDHRETMEHSYFISLAGIPLPKEYYIQVAHLAFWSCIIAGGTCVALGAALLLSRSKSWVVYVVPVVTVMEVLIFARLHRPAFELDGNKRPEFDNLYVQNPGDYRVLDVSGVDNSTRNYGVDSRKYTIWGYDPVILDRYAQFVVFASGKRTIDPVLLKAAIWGIDPLTLAVHEMENYKFPPSGIDGDMTLFQLLRCRYVIINPGEWNEPASIWPTKAPPMPRFYFSNSFSVHDTKEAIFDEMKQDSFDPSQRVLLESEPVPKPAVLSNGAEPTGSIKVLSETTDSIEFDIHVDENTLLIITDSYSKNWIVKPIESTQDVPYTVMPVDYTLRGIPLAAGNHHFLLEFAPASYTVGRWISLLSGIFFLICCGFVGYKRYSTSAPNGKAKHDE